MTKINFNHNWKICLNGIERSISLPFDMMIYEERDISSKGGINISYFKGGDYTYTKEFENTFKNQIIILEFEGVYRNAEIYLNNELIHQEEYGYNTFFVDITNHLKEGVNELKVIAHNHEQPNSRWYTGSGIYRDVNLILLPLDHIDIDGVKIKTSYNGNIDVKLNGNINGKATIKVFDNEQLLLEDDFNVKEEYVSRLENIIPWSTNNPKLYKIEIIYKEDIRTFNIGFRSVEINNNGLFINGNREILLGACIHHDNGLIGANENKIAAYRKIKLLKQAGYNAIRSAHNPISKTMLDIADELGMYILDEYVDCWFMHKTKYDYASLCTKNYRHDIELMVNKDYNHPSVIMYSTGNEVGESQTKQGVLFTKTLTDTFHEFDDTRSVTCGINIFFNWLSAMGLGVYSDKKAEKEEKNNGTKKKKSVGSEFFNDLAGKLGANFMKNCASLYPCDVKTRDVFKNMDVAGYNYAITRYKKDLKHYPNRIIVGSETFCSDAGKFYDFALNNPRLIGDFVWAGMDYIGEVGVGSWTSEEYCDKDFTHQVGWLTAGSGRIDITGRFNSEVDYTLVCFKKKDIAIGVVPVNHYHSRHSASAWKFSKAYPIYNYPGYENKETEVEVYSRSKYVALYQNNKLIKIKKTHKSYKTVFKIKYQKGIITAVGLDENKCELFETSLKSGEGNPHVEIIEEIKPINIGDLGYYRIQIRNDHDILPAENVDIEIKKLKNCTFEGLGNGCSYSKEGYKSLKNKTFYGDALLIAKKENNEQLEIVLNTNYGEIRF